ncbi:crossover junction endonuclease EME1 isoform X2 [Gouania willdenowi]|uniref:crossover junction endonuclease EME1 isoform X2 n=1 Tax=Gouania willdenowi TaxID=441366 RepID=UPI0010550CE3|nr:crossover junction endonuclease EME1 isoform X2 [Gouania willdenowi]
MMGSCSESSSDPDVDLPALDLLLSGASAKPGRADVMMISSDSDDDAPYVPLAQRLQQRQNHVMIRAPSADHSTSSDLHHHQSAVSGSEPLSTQQGGSARRKTGPRTAEKVQASKEEAVRKRNDHKEEAVRKRKDHKEEAVRKRKEQERMKAERKAAAEAVKALRPEECIKHMVVTVDPALLQQEGGGALLAALQTLGCSCSIEKHTLPRSIGWMRRAPCAQTGEAGTSEPNVVMHVTVDDFITLVHGYIQEGLGRSDCGPTLTSWVLERQRQHQDKTLSLVVIELDNYFRLQKLVKQKKTGNAVTAEEGGPGKTKRRRGSGGVEAQLQLTRVQVEEAVGSSLQLHTGVPVHFLSTWQDFSNHVTMVTKAVAEAPFKRDREQTGFSFHLDSEWAGGQKVDREGRGLVHVWKRQIQQLNRVSADMAAAIIAAYPSPQLLLKMNEWCCGKRINMLQLYIMSIK